MLPTAYSKLRAEVSVHTRISHLLFEEKQECFFFLPFSPCVILCVNVTPNDTEMNHMLPQQSLNVSETSFGGNLVSSPLEIQIAIGCISTCHIRPILRCFVVVMQLSVISSTPKMSSQSIITSKISRKTLKWDLWESGSITKAKKKGGHIITPNTCETCDV